VTRFAELLRVLAANNVEFIIVGGVAAVAHGSPRSTQDVDVVYERSRANLEHLVQALQDHQPYLRGAPPGLPFRFNLDTLRAGLNFTLTTDLGWIDLLGEITGGGSYRDLEPHSISIDVYGVTCRVLDLEKLIETKKAAGRPKDFEALAELEFLRKRMKH
jgi:predicted nucleotidyltransferase